MKLFEKAEYAAELGELYRELQEARTVAIQMDEKLERLRKAILETSVDIKRIAVGWPPSRKAMARLRGLLDLAGEASNALAFLRKELDDVRLHQRAAAVQESMK